MSAEALDKVLRIAGEQPAARSATAEGADLRVLVQASYEALSLACSTQDEQEAGRAALAALTALEAVARDLAVDTMPDWVELTAFDPHAVALGGNKPGEGKLPYGDVTYADPGYQSDGKKRYPVDNETHIRAAWAYINKGKNAGKYSSSQVASIKAKIKSAASKAGIEISEESGEKVAATMVALAMPPQLRGKGGKNGKNGNGKNGNGQDGDGGEPTSMEAEHHMPFHGTHSHPHSHNGDNRHGGW